MLLEILFSTLCGIILGMLTGLTPGIHINLVGAVLVSLSLSAFSNINPIYLSVFIVAMSISHTFFDFIPSIFLGCPETGTELSILPGHQMLKQGRGYEAVALTSFGGLASVIVLIFLFYPLVKFLPLAYSSIKEFIPYLLIGVCIFMIAIEKKKINSLIVFALTGLLGYIVLNMQINEPLLPLLSGLFGASSLILSIKTNTQIPKQEITQPEIKFFKPLIGSVLASMLCGFLPGLGSGQAAIIGSSISKTKQEDFLVLIGATNILTLALSFIGIYSIGKARTGAAVAVQTLQGEISIQILIVLIEVIFISGIISFLLTLYTTKRFSEKISKMNYTKISLATLAIMILVVFLFSGFLGILIFAISTLTGIYCINQEVKRTNMMACLLIPTIILYLRNMIGG